MNDCVTKAKSDEEHDCGRMFNESIMCAIEVLIARKSVLVRALVFFR